MACSARWIDPCLRELQIGWRRAFLAQELDYIQGQAGDDRDERDLPEEVVRPDEFPVYKKYGSDIRYFS